MSYSNSYSEHKKLASKREAHLTIGRHMSPYTGKRRLTLIRLMGENKWIGKRVVKGFLKHFNGYIKSSNGLGNVTNRWPKPFNGMVDFSN